MEDAFMNFASATAAWDSAFTDLTTTNGNLSTHLRQKEDHILSLKSQLCNLKVLAATRATKMKGFNKRVQPYR